MNPKLYRAGGKRAHADLIEFQSSDGILKTNTVNMHVGTD